jgi:LuxR family maltose regulon positive regulatory protein
MLGLGQGYYDLGQMEAADQALESALALCQGSGTHYAALGCILYLMQVQAVRGALRRMIANGEKGLLWVQEWSGSAGQGGQLARVADQIRRELGRAHYERNDLEQAAVYLHEAVETFELAQSLLRLSVYVPLVRLHHALENVDGALRTLQKMVHISLTPGLVLLDVPLATQIAELRLLLSQSRPELNELFVQAVEWADGSGLRPDDDFRYEQEYNYLTLARVRVAQGRAEKVLPLLDRLAAAASSAGRAGQLIAYLSLQAVAHHACGRADAALDTLSRALALGEPEGYVRTFLDLGPPMGELLRQTLVQGVAVDYVGKLLTAMEGTTKNQVQKAESPSPPQAGHPLSVVGRPSSVAHTNVGRPSSPDSLGSALIEPLNDRELQILRLLAADLSDREIAQELYLSINTVKWYNRQIYAKLGVRRRDPAVARALERGILRDG